MLRNNTKFYQLIAISLLAMGCASNSSDIVRDLNGKWIEEQKEPIVVSSHDSSQQLVSENSTETVYRYDGFTIINNRFDNYDGFHRKLESQSDSLIHKYKGNLSNYKISGDSLFILDPFTNDYTYEASIESADKNRLTLKTSDNDIKSFKRDEIKFHENFDRIEMSASNCYGPCPSFDLSLNKNGNLSFDGKTYTNLEGEHVAQAPFPLVDYVFSKFEQLEVDKLNDEYAADFTDAQTIKVKLYNNGKIIKEITDYGMNSPQELLWAIQSLKDIYLLERLSWDKVDNSNS